MTQSLVPDVFGLLMVVLSTANYDIDRDKLLCNLLDASKLRASGGHEVSMFWNPTPSEANDGPMPWSARDCPSSSE